MAMSSKPEEGMKNVRSAKGKLDGMIWKKGGLQRPSPFFLYMMASVYLHYFIVQIRVRYKPERAFMSMSPVFILEYGVGFVSFLFAHYPSEEYIFKRLTSGSFITARRTIRCIIFQESKRVMMYWICISFIRLIKIGLPYYFGSAFKLNVFRKNLV
jgi:hypothetical protein